MPYTRAADLTVAYELSGAEDAPVLVLVNGLGQSMHVWSAILAPLSTTHRVLRYDLRGHGLTSDGRPHNEGIDVLADDLVALLDALGIARANVAGLSIGGLVAQCVAARYPNRIASIVLLATGNQIGTRVGWDERIAAVERDGMTGIAEAVLQRWFTPRTSAERPEIVDGFRTMLLRTPAGGYAAGCRAVRDADLRGTDAAIRCPALVVSGAADAVTPPSAGSAMHEAIPGAQMRVVEGASHILPVERPDATADAIRAFLAGLHERPAAVDGAIEAAR